MPLNFRDRLSYKQAKYTVLITFLIGLCLSWIQIGFDFYKEREVIDSTVTQIIKMHQKAISQAVFNVDAPMINTVLDGLFEYNAIRRVLVIDEFQQIFGEKIRPPKKIIWNWFVKMLFGQEKIYEIPLIFNQSFIGTIKVYIDNNVIASNFIHRALLILVGGLLRNILVAIILILFFYYSLTKPLLDVINHISSVDPYKPAEKLIDIPKFHAKDELGSVINSINILLVSFQTSMDKRSEAEQNLNSHKTHLEQIVNERTKELRDVIEKMNLANQLMALQSSELKTTNEQLEEMAKKAEKATKAKSEFLANMSHEIRTPMNAIVGMLYLVLQTDLDSKQQDYLLKIQSATNSLLSIINDILDFSKIEAGKLYIDNSPFDIEDIFDSLANMMGIKAEEKNLELVFDVSKDVPVKLIGDSLRLNQILVNLINNAIKFTEKGEVVLKVEKINMAQDKEVFIKFSVKDTGIGMTLEQVDNLFKPFTQADCSFTRKYGGTGLGLAISKHLVEMMHGQIFVKSEYGKGSEFSFIIKFGRHFEDKKELLGVSNFQGMNAMVVDDNASNRIILASFIESLGFKVKLITCASDAITELEKAIAKQQPYHLVLMDWKMPGMDGIEATKRIKQNPRISHIPEILMISAYGREEIMQLSKKVGIDAFLIKPVNRSVLLDTLMQLFGKNHTVKPGSQIKKFDPNELRSIRGAKILLVEDHEINQIVAKELFERLGFHVTVAKNGVEALKIVSDSEYSSLLDLIFMDLQMPEMDGYEATKKIRELGCKIPIVAMTAHAMMGQREKCINLGMSDFTTKPINPDELVTILKKWINIKDLNIQPLKDENDSYSFFENQPDGIDTRAGLERLGGNKKLYLNLLLQFNDEFKDAPLKIKTLIQNGYDEKAKQYIHTLKGVSSNISAMDLYRALKNLESVLNNGKNEWETSFDTFSEATKIVINSISNIKISESVIKNAATKQSVKTEPIDIEAVAVQLSHLSNMLEEGNFMALDSVDEIRKSLTGLGFDDILDRLDKCLSKFDFENALSILAQIASDLMKLSDKEG